MYLHVSNIQNLSSSWEQVDEKGQGKAENSDYYSQFLFDFCLSKCKLVIGIITDYWVYFSVN